MAWSLAPPLFLPASARCFFADFNMGIGLIAVTSRDQAEPFIGELAARGGRDARVIGEVVSGEPPSVSYVNL